MKVEKEYKDIDENLRKWFKDKWVNIGKKVLHNKKQPAYFL